MLTTAYRVAVRAPFAMLFAVILSLWAAAPARAADPIRIGFSMALTGGVAPNGKQLLLALEIWRDDVNAKGGLMGRPVELVYYDDQSNPNNVPGIYTKLISVDKVDLLLGPYATNMIAPAMPVHHAGEQDDHRHARREHQSPVQLSAIFLDDPGRPEGTLSFSSGVRAGDGAEPQAEDGGDPRGRRRVRTHRLRRRA